MCVSECVVQWAHRQPTCSCLESERRGWSSGAPSTASLTLSPASVAALGVHVLQSHFFAATFPKRVLVPTCTSTDLARDTVDIICARQVLNHFRSPYSTSYIRTEFRGRGTLNGSVTCVVLKIVLGPTGSVGRDRNASSTPDGLYQQHLVLDRLVRSALTLVPCTRYKHARAKNERERTGFRFTFSFSRLASFSEFKLMRQKLTHLTD